MERPSIERPSMERPAPPRAAAPANEGTIDVLAAEGDALRAIARAVGSRWSGALALGPERVKRRIVLQDGDILTAGSASDDETLVAFLVGRGDLPKDVGARIAAKIQPFGRHAGAALIAHGHLGQEDLWPVLRAHAEWIIGKAIGLDEGTAALEPEPPGRLRAEPSVFGGSTGAEVVVEAARRVIPPAEALRRLGGKNARIAEGSRASLLIECALKPEEEELVRRAAGKRVGELMTDPESEIASVLIALSALSVIEILTPSLPDDAPRSEVDPLDVEALRQRVRARLSLVEEGDYFSLLGVSRDATGYEVRRAYIELRRSFEPSRVLTASTADLGPDLRTLIEVLDEAYEILREPRRRDRYRRAIEAGPP